MERGPVRQEGRQVWFFHDFTGYRPSVGRNGGYRLLVAALFLVCSLAVSVRADQPSVTLMQRAEVGFETLTTQDGLSNNTVMALAQDTTGFIWIGTLGGLNRYDGNRVRSFEHDPADPQSLPNGFVRALHPAPDGGMWLGTHTAGIAYYSPRTDSFRTLGAGPDGLGHVQVYALASDGGAGVWVATVAGLDHVGPDLRVRERVRPGEKGFPAGYVFAVFRDRHGTLWAGTERGAAFRRAGDADWQMLTGDETAARALARGVWSFYEDSQDRLWIGTNGSGVVSVAPGGAQAQSHPTLTGDDTSLGRSTVRGIVEERPGVLWISIYGGGIAEYDAGRDRLRLIRADPNIPRALKGNFTRGLIKDRGGVVWVATNMGASRHDSVPSGIVSIATGQTRGFSGRDTWSLWTDSRNGLWLGLDDGGLDRLDLETGHIAPYGRGKEDGNAGGTPIYAIAGDATGALWIGTAGLARLYPEAGRGSLTALPIPGASGRDITALRSAGSDLWIGTYYGLIRHSTADGSIRTYTTASGDGDAPSLSNNEVWAILPDEAGHVWIGTANGLNILMPDGRLRHVHRQPGRADSLPHDYVSALVRDRQGRLWLGTVGGGVALLVAGGPADEELHFRAVTQRDGLPSNAISALTLGSDGRIWASTDNGLAAIDSQDFTVARIDPTSAGNVTSYLPGAVTALGDGGLVFGGANGITLVQPSQIRPHIFQDALAVTAVTAGGRSVNASALNLPAGQRTIRVPTDNRRLEVEFSLMDFAVGGNLLYGYRLDGFDQDWLEAEKDRRAAVYTNLPPGQYTLRLRVSDRDAGAIAERAFTVAVPHLWHEWPWVRFMGLILALTAGASMVMLIERARIAKLSEAKRELEAKVEERTQSLREANDRLADLATRDPLTGIFNRRAFMERLDHEWGISLRHGHPFCVLILDLDNFKEVNDTYGHLVGDTVLRELAQRVKEVLRDTDLLARYGGEEFVVLTPHTDAAAACIVAERMRHAAGSMPVNLEGASLQVTVSIGIAQARPTTETQTSLFKRADTALYKAKTAGRNRVKLSA